MKLVQELKGLANYAGRNSRLLREFQVNLVFRRIYQRKFNRNKTPQTIDLAICPL